MVEETRELKISISLSAEEWENLERYAISESKTLQEYIVPYIKCGFMEALREGRIIEAFRSEE